MVIIMGQALCECFGLFDMTPEPEDPRSCLHCGKPAPPKKWRCTACQFQHDAKRDRVIELLQANRRQESAAAQR